MKLILLQIPSAKEKWSEAAAAFYTQKINQTIAFEIQSLKPAKNAREQADQKVKSESEEILKKLSSDDFVILFDEKGKNFDSIGFSKLVQRALNSGKKRLVFIIGGAFGVDESVKKRADQSVQLSSMTMNHLVAETMSLEQIYRAFAIINNKPYHNI